LSGDSSRSVRRSTIDAVVDAHREGLRPLLERALDDPDAWIRWKAVRGIAALGVTPSRAVIEARASDPDFRVRLEATRTLAR
jgi:HEAT repeats